MRVPNDITAVIAAKDEEATIADVVRSCLPFAREVLAVVDWEGPPRRAIRRRRAALAIEPPSRRSLRGHV
jgi:hypothetical protein